MEQIFRENDIINQIRNAGHRVVVNYNPVAKLKDAALAENIEISVRDEHADVTFDFICPNCGKRHWATESDTLNGLFSGVGWTLACGRVGVRMPWHPSPPRERKSIYGEAVKLIRKVTR
jgi:hypothetical protein